MTSPKVDLAHIDVAMAAIAEELPDLTEAQREALALELLYRDGAAPEAGEALRAMLATIDAIEPVDVLPGERAAYRCKVDGGVVVVTMAGELMKR